MRNLFCTSHSNQDKKNEIGWRFGTMGERREGYVGGIGWDRLD